MSHPTILGVDDVVLIVVDIQEKLLPFIANADQVVANTRRLILGAGELKAPIVMTEQYPKGLGPTVPEVRQALDQVRDAGGTVHSVEKTTFACTSTDAFLDTLEKVDREQVVLCGIEAHICVLQTALGLVEEGSMTYAVGDAIGSRSPENRVFAIERMRSAGVIIPVTESVLYEMLEDSRHPAFKPICNLVK